MPIDKLTPRQLNADADSKLLTKSGMLDALNLYSGDDGGNQGVLKNIKGNLILTGSGSLPPDARVIGKVEDTRTGLAYLFVYSATASDQGIWVYDPNEVLGVDKIKPIYKSPVFDFPQDGFVKGDIVYTNAIRTFTDKGVDFEKDAIIYFTDGVNEPRKINAYRAFEAEGQEAIHGDPSGSDLNAINEADFITACPKVPLTPITFEFASSGSERRNNFIGTRGFQFAYQHIYIDGMESAISPYSDIAFPPSLINQGAASFVDHSEYNECRLTIPTPGPEIKLTRILCRQGNTGSFLVIEEITPEESNNDYLFYNDKVLSGVSTDEVNKQFDSVPRTAVSQTTSSNRLFYGNYLDGFDNVKVDADTEVIYHEREEDFKTFNVKVIPSIAPTESRKNLADVSVVGESDIPVKGKTTGFILDCTELPDEMTEGTVIKASVTLAPDQNWHLYNFPQSNVNGGSFHQSNQMGPSDQGSINDSIDGANSPFFVQPDADASTGNQGIFGTNDGVGGTVNWTSPDGTTVPVTYGTSAGNPLILKGGAITFSVEIKTNLNLESAARIKINKAIRKAFTRTGVDSAGEPLSTEDDLIFINGIFTEESDPFEVIERSVLPSYSYNLGLGDGDLIQQSFLNEDNPSSSLSKLLVAVRGEVAGVDDYDSSYLKVPFGAFIVNSATVGFKAFQGSNEYTFENPEKSHIGLTVGSMDDVETHTCIHEIPSGGIVDFSNVAASSWVVITKGTLESQNFTLSDFLSDNGLAADLNFTDVDFNIEGVLSEGNITNQLSYLSPLEGHDFFNVNSDSICVFDGEGGPGGSASGRVSGSELPYDELFLYNQGSITVNPIAVNSSSGILYDYSDTAYFAGKEKVNISFGSAPSGPGGAAHILPLVNFSGEYLVPFVSDEDQNVIAAESVNFTRLQSYVEVLSAFASIVPPNGEYQDRSFKTEASHDFGVVYYDQRGRHGFVNPIDSVYVEGYSGLERAEALQGRASIKIKIISTPPEWAHFYKFVYAKNTSVKDFIQYSAAGAFVSSNESQEISESNNNIYVSLNHLQGHPISYVSSFGARTPEGGLNFYKFEPGDKLRVISYAEGEERKYPIDLDFEVLGSVNLGNTDNPLSNDPTESQKGEFVIIKNNPNAGNFSFTDVSSGTSSWGDNCIIELRTPLKELEDDQRFYYEISDTYNVVKSNNGTDLVHSPAEVELTKGDVWFRRVAVNVSDLEGGVYPSLILDDDGNDDPPQSNFKNVYLEASTATDLYRADSIGIGRPNVVLDGAKETVREATLTYSDPSNPESTKVNYSSFNASLANFKDLPEKYNSLQYLGDHGDSIFALQKDKASRIPVGRSIISSASGNESIVASRDVLGDAIYYAGQSGCDNDPSSVADIEGTVFFANKSLGKIYKYSRNGGVEAVSDKGMANFFRSIFKDALEGVEDGSHVRVVGGYDPLKEEYLITVINLVDLVTDGVVIVDQPSSDLVAPELQVEFDLKTVPLPELIEEFVARGDGSDALTDENLTNEVFSALSSALTARQFNAIKKDVDSRVKSDLNADGAIGSTDLLLFLAQYASNYNRDNPATDVDPAVDDSQENASDTGT